MNPFIQKQSGLKIGMILVSVALSAAFFSACTQSSSLKDVSSSQTQALTGEALVAQGKKVYLANCIACHNSDPAKAGALGPEVNGSSKALLEARILHATYPDGYTPKRQTRTMAALPFLKNDIDALYAYLNPAK